VRQVNRRPTFVASLSGKKKSSSIILFANLTYAPITKGSLGKSGPGPDDIGDRHDAFSGRTREYFA